MCWIERNFYEMSDIIITVFMPGEAKSPEIEVYTH